MENDIGDIAMNRNVNITSPDSSDNPRKDTRQRRNSFGDYVQLSLGISLMAIVYVFLWFFGINISNFYCWTQYDIACQSTDIVHWVFLAGILLALLLLVMYSVQNIVNAGYLFQRGVYLDRRQVSINTQGLIDVMKTSARSEATYGLDTYSPSISTVAPPKPVLDTVVDDIFTTGLVEGDPEENAHKGIEHDTSDIES